jgi:transcriptional regulator with XRE-family HTH domain
VINLAQQIKIGKTIARLRKERGLLQEDLAEHLGVSKPAVSKWESGQNYPDITLLPVIASYFGITVDELRAYRPQMTGADLRKLYVTLAGSFAHDGFENAYATCQEYIKNYYSCWPLLLNLCVLIINSAFFLIMNTRRSNEVFAETIHLLERIEKHSDDKSLANQALHVRASAYMMLGDTSKVIDLLGDTVTLPFSSEVLLATAYIKNQTGGQALSLLQGSVYKNIVGLLGAYPELLKIYENNFPTAEKWVTRIKKVIDAFGIENLQPATLLPIYLSSAALYVKHGKTAEALVYLKAYTKLLTSSHMFPLRLKRTELFDSINSFFGYFDFGTTPPRSEAIIRQYFKEAFIKNPAFDVLKGNAEYTAIYDEISSIVDAIHTDMPMEYIPFLIPM